MYVPLEYFPSWMHNLPTFTKYYVLDVSFVFSSVFKAFVLVPVATLGYHPALQNLANTRPFPKAKATLVVFFHIMKEKFVYFSILAGIFGDIGLPFLKLN